MSAPSATEAWSVSCLPPAPNHKISQDHLLTTHSLPDARTVSELSSTYHCKRPRFFYMFWNLLAYLACLNMVHCHHHIFRYIQYPSTLMFLCWQAVGCRGYFPASSLSTWSSLKPAGLMGWLPPKTNDCHEKSVPPDEKKIRAWLILGVTLMTGLTSIMYVAICSSICRLFNGALYESTKWEMGIDLSDFPSWSHGSLGQKLILFGKLGAGFSKWNLPSNHFRTHIEPQT